MVGISAADRHPADDRAVGVPPPPRLGAYPIAGGSFLVLAGVLLLAYGAYGWAALFLILAAGNLAGGYWYITMARSESARA